jgi:glycolate oxidase iron-sulfur subunit
VETRLADWIRDTDAGREADAILRACVHCGFCNATCPTYQLLGDELDGPRGRIYQIKGVLEGAPVTRTTQVHLDRCLTCRACETTCPSGVEYGRLLEIGREVVDARVARPVLERVARALVRETVSRRPVFAFGVALARRLAPLLPARLRAKLGDGRPAGAAAPAARHQRRVLLLTSCSQDALLPAVDRAAMRVLDGLGFSAFTESKAGCCGALRAHLSDPEGARVAARRNVDAWWPHIEAGVEALVMTASGCGVQVRDYGRLLATEAAYAARAARIAALTRDLSEWLREHGRWPARDGAPPVAVAFHAPCTLQHGQKLVGVVEPILEMLGARLVAVPEAHLCCGSAGSYSLLQPALATALRARKLEALTAHAPTVILSANVGCIAHLGAAARIPVRHWIEWVDERLHATRRA